MTTQVVHTRVSKPFIHAARVNRALTASAEKRLLVWLAARAPAWVSSDQLTVLGFAAQVATGVAYAMAPHFRWALPVAVLCIGLNWFGDSLDGTLARVRDQQRPRYGFYVDHIVDIFGSTALMAGLGLSGVLHWQVALWMLITFLLLSAESYLSTYTLSTFQLSQGFFGPTEIRLLLVAGTLALMRSPYSTILGHRFLLFDVGGVIASVSMFGTGVWVSMRNMRTLYREEPLP